MNTMTLEMKKSSDRGEIVYRRGRRGRGRRSEGSRRANMASTSRPECQPFCARLSSHTTTASFFSLFIIDWLCGGSWLASFVNFMMCTIQCFVIFGPWIKKLLKLPRFRQTGCICNAISDMYINSRMIRNHVTTTNMHIKSHSIHCYVYGESRQVKTKHMGMEMGAIIYYIVEWHYRHHTKLSLSLVSLSYKA